MRFGIMATQINYLIPANASPEQIMVSLSGFDHAALVRLLAEKGFNPIELGGDLSLFLPQSYSPQAIEGLTALRAELGINYTLHLPLWSVEPSTPLTPVRLGSVQAIIQAIQVSRPLAPEVYILHATGNLAGEFYRMKLPEAAKELILRQFQNGARQSIRTILQETGLSSRQLAIETVEFPFDLTLEIAEELDLSMCLDTGHVLVGYSGPVDLFDALERCLPRLAEIHLHDGPWQGPNRVIGYFKDHQQLGKGDLDISGLMQRLEETGWDGPVIFELRLEEALASLEYIQQMRSNRKD